MDDAMENMPQSALNMQQSAQGAPVRLRKTAPKRKPKPSLLTSTLDEFLVRITSTSEGRRSSSPEPQEQHLPPKIEPFCIIRSLRNQQKHGRCTAFGRAARQYSANSKYKEVGRVNLDPNLDRSHLSAMQLNADGSLLAVTMDLGIVAVYELSALRPGFAGASGIPVIQVMFERSVRTMTRLAWDPLAPNWVYTFGARGTSIDGFDVSKDKEHEPLEAVTCAYRNSAQRMLGCPGDLPRYSAIDFFKIEGPHLIAAAGSDGAVALWDKRVHSRSCSKLQGPQRTGALLSVQVAPDGRAVIAGSECGQVLMWDVRGGRAPTAQLGAYGPARHPLLASVKLKNSLAAVRGLTHQTYLPVTAVRSLTLDPCDPRRAAFSLHCGWHGVLDLVSQQEGPRHAQSQVQNLTVGGCRRA
ncbi:hypothetical protein WJX75_002692 [Coccomyxa subellipsoidea]|uniref:WD40 repeat-like protein n=1 Tax=Coccomyxa subellipsoidea TaxID=248742 RepID=A0ABR2YMH0_9CHLO